MLERYEYGNITIVYNLIFNKNNQPDHASLAGRPCIILNQNEEKTYVIPLTSKQNFLKYQSTNFPIDQSELTTYGGFPKMDKPENVCLYEIIERKNCYFPIIAQIKTKKYYELLNVLLNTDLEKYPKSKEILLSIKDDLLKQKEILDEEFRIDKIKKEKTKKRKERLLKRQAK